MKNNILFFFLWSIIGVTLLMSHGCDEKDERSSKDSGTSYDSGNKENENKKEKTTTDSHIDNNIEENEDKEMDAGEDVSSDIITDTDMQVDSDDNTDKIEDIGTDSSIEQISDTDDSDTDPTDSYPGECYSYCTIGAECGPDGCGGTCGSECEEGMGCNIENNHCVPLCDTDCPQLNWITIKGGAFLMGSDQFENTVPVHKVTVNTFDITKTEITTSQYRKCVEAGQCDNYASSSCYFEEGTDFDNHPMNCSRWIDGVDFCTWVGGRLPSEAEWEYAARSGGKDVKYPWGDEEATCEYAVIADASLVDGCGKRSAWEVCSKPKGNTEQGLCDMSGNISEWVQDTYRDNYKLAPFDGSAWMELSEYKVVRGGRYSATYSDWVSVYYREEADRHPVHEERYGFRCVR